MSNVRCNQRKEKIAAEKGLKRGMWDLFVFTALGNPGADHIGTPTQVVRSQFNFSRVNWNSHCIPLRSCLAGLLSSSIRRKSFGPVSIPTFISSLILSLYHIKYLLLLSYSLLHYIMTNDFCYDTYDNGGISK